MPIWPYWLLNIEIHMADNILAGGPRKKKLHFFLFDIFVSIFFQFLYSNANMAILAFALEILVKISQLWTYIAIFYYKNVDIMVKQDQTSCKMSIFTGIFK